MSSQAPRPATFAFEPRHDDERIGSREISGFAGGGYEDWPDLFRREAIEHVWALQDSEELLQVAEDPAARWLTIKPLTEAYRMGRAPGLEQVLRSRCVADGPRTMAMMAMRAAGEQPPEEVLIPLCRTSKDVELRMAAAVMLGWSTTPAARAEVVRRLTDQNEHVVMAAALAATRQGNVDAVPVLIRLCSKWSNHRRLLDSLGSIGGQQASEALVGMLRKALKTRPHSRAVSDVLHGFDATRGAHNHFVEAGAHDAAYYERVARSVLLWWDRVRGKPLGEARAALREMARLAPVRRTLELIAQEGSNESLELLVGIIEAQYRAQGGTSALFDLLEKVRVLESASGIRFEPPHAGAFADGEMVPHIKATIANMRVWWAKRKAVPSRPTG